MPKLFVKYSVDAELAGFLKLVASAVDVVPVDVSVLVEPVAHGMRVAWPLLVVLVVDVIHVALPLLVVLAVDVINVAWPLLVLLPVDDVLFVILIIPMHQEVLQLLQIPFVFLLAEYLLPLLHVAMFVL